MFAQNLKQICSYTLNILNRTTIPVFWLLAPVEKTKENQNWSVLTELRSITFINQSIWENVVVLNESKYHSIHCCVITPSNV